MLKVYFKHNCATCISALALMKKNTAEEIETVEYLVETPSVAELKEIVKMLGISAEQLVRKKEPLYKEKYEGKKISDDKWLKIMNENPILIERPIVVMDGRAIIGRPVESIVEFINKKEGK
jgi:arsenate reductase